MDLSIIIVSYNVADKLKENLSSLFKSEGDFSYEVFVVDNNSADNSAQLVEKEFKKVNLIKNNTNLGFAKANNLAIKKAKGEYILLLNPDMRVFSDTLYKMLKWMQKNPQADVAGCHLLDEKEKTIDNVRLFPKFCDQLAIVLKLPHFFPKILNKYLAKNFDYQSSAKVDSIRGSFFMLRATEKKYLDERYFIWFEEVDFCKQVYKDGGEVWYSSEAKCIDLVGRSFAKVPVGLKQKYFKDSMLKYFAKWHPSWQVAILKNAWLIVSALLSVLGIFTFLFFKKKK